MHADLNSRMPRVLRRIARIPHTDAKWYVIIKGWESGLFDDW